LIQKKLKNNIPHKSVTTKINNSTTKDKRNGPRSGHLAEKPHATKNANRNESNTKQQTSNTKIKNTNKKENLERYFPQGPPRTRKHVGRNSYLVGILSRSIRRGGSTIIKRRGRSP
jgi:hypothetical protein